MDLRLERKVELLEREERSLARRAAIAAISAVLLFVAGVAGTAAAFRGETRPVLETIATVPLPLAMTVGAWAWVQRGRAAVVRGRKMEARAELEARAAEEPEPDLPASGARPADLLAIERLLRTFYESSGTSTEARWGRFVSLFTPRAPVDLGPWPAGAALPVERFVALARLEGRAVLFREIARTLHVLGDFAVAISSYEAHAPDSLDVRRGVNCIRMRRALGGWEIEGLTSRSVEEAVTIRRSVAQATLTSPPPLIR